MRPVTLLPLLLCSAGLAAPALAEGDAQCLEPAAALRPGIEAPCFSFEHQGVTHTYRLFAPPTDPADGLPRPLLVLLHGALDSGAGLEAITRHAFNRLAEREGVIIAYPDGVDRGWNVDLVPIERDDVATLVALIDAVNARAPVDRSTVMAAGFSNGGLMALRLACEASAHFTAVSAVGAGLPRALGGTCAPERPVGVQVVIGDSDPIVPAAGGAIRFMGQQFGDLLPAADGTALFVARAEALAGSPCGTAQEEVVDTRPDDGTSLRISRWPCPGTRVELVEVVGGGHTWPGGLQFMDAGVIGVTSQEAEPATIVWNFLDRFRVE
ncbi:alpha/beta hydrolase family esterase [Zavarzinia sp. CC-PAN008]|uniref:alpha/beta hydrolase family esterase n=1 Tax=Zavarzinia sp. CC-PAN008 TaxID=3243332 RepID=UPI003F744548